MDNDSIPIEFSITHLLTMKIYPVFLGYIQIVCRVNPGGFSLLNW